VDGVLFDKSMWRLVRYPQAGVGGYVIPESVILVEDGFADCTGLTGVTIPRSVLGLARYPFRGCNNLTTIEVDALNSTFGSADGVLFNKNLDRLIKYPEGRSGAYGIPDIVTSISSFAFADSASLTRAIIPNSVTNIGGAAFAGCTSLTGVMIPDSVTGIGSSVFAGCSNLNTIEVDANNPAYSSLEGALFDKNQTALIRYPEGKGGIYTVPGGVTSIERYAFSGCSILTRVTIPESVSSVNHHAFFGCTSVTNITIPGSVTNIGYSAFLGCANLAGIYFQGDAPQLESRGSFNVDAIAYYLPGTKGWGGEWGGCPTALWDPQVETNDGSFGVSPNGFGFTITASNDITIVVEVCTSLINPTWLAVGTKSLVGGTFYFSDPEWANWPHRFYRVRSP
jgi:hypothetical protein